MSIASHAPAFPLPLPLPPIRGSERVARKKPERKRDLFLSAKLSDVLMVIAALLIGTAAALGVSQAGTRSKASRIAAAEEAHLSNSQRPRQWRIESPSVGYERMYMKH